MKRLALIAALLTATLIPTLAQAGGGVPNTYQGLRTIAETVVLDRIADFQATGQIPEWAENECHFWRSMLTNINFYFENEKTFSSKYERIKVRSAWQIRLAKATGEDMDMIPTYRIRRDRAKIRLAQMADWHQQLLDYKYGNASPNERYYCAAEQLCVSEEPEPQFSKVLVQKMSVSQQIVYGVHRHLFAFALNVFAEDMTYDEDGDLENVTLSMLMTNNAFENVSDCTLEQCFPGEPCIVLAVTEPDYEDGDSVAELHFDMSSDEVYLPAGSTEQFNVFCDLMPALPENSYINIGFINTLGTSPNEAIEVRGMSSAETLEVEPNVTMSTVLTN